MTPRRCWARVEDAREPRGVTKVGNPSCVYPSGPMRGARPGAVVGGKPQPSGAVSHSPIVLPSVSVA